MKKEKIKSDWELESNLELSEKAEGFDTASQDVFKNVKVLAYSFYEFKNTKNIGVDAKHIKVEDYDLLSLVIIRLGSRDYKGENELIGFLNAFFYKHENKKEVLSRYIDFGQEEESKEVSVMKGFGWAVYNDGKEDGKKEAHISIVKSMHKKGMPLEQIAEIVEISIEEVEQILKG